MKIWTILIFLLSVSSYLTGQIYELPEDTLCRNTVINTTRILKGCKSYTWKTSEGFISTEVSPAIKFADTGSHWIVLEVRPFDKMVTYDSLRLIQHEPYFSITDPKPDIYYRIKDKNGQYIYSSRSITDLDIPGYIPGMVILHSEESYLFEFWDFDIFDGDDFLGSIFINNPQGAKEYQWGQVKMFLNTKPADTLYTKTMPILVANPKIIQVQNDLNITLANEIPSFGSVFWRLGQQVITSSNLPNPFSPQEDGCYTAMVSIPNVCQFVETEPYCFMKTGVESILPGKPFLPLIVTNDDVFQHPDSEGQLFLYSIQGILVKKSDSVMELSGLSTGIYLVVLQKDEHIHRQLVTVVNR